jgi:hypothetical protein
MLQNSSVALVLGGGDPEANNLFTGGENVICSIYNNIYPDGNVLLRCVREPNDKFVRCTYVRVGILDDNICVLTFASSLNIGLG